MTTAKTTKMTTTIITTTKTRTKTKTTRTKTITITKTTAITITVPLTTINITFHSFSLIQESSESAAKEEISRLKEEINLNKRYVEGLMVEISGWDHGSAFQTKELRRALAIQQNEV